MGWKYAYCDQCDKRSPTMVMIKDELWEQICGDKSRDILCLSCMEKRLGREIGLEDIKQTPLMNDLLLLSVIIKQTHQSILDRIEYDKIKERF